MIIRPGSEAMVAGLQRELEAAEQEQHRLWAERAMNIKPAATAPEGPKNEAEIAQVEAEIIRIKAEIARHVWSLSTLGSFFYSKN